VSDQASLLRAILDNPEDQAVRLVYADFLDDQGEEERAGFIRAQCQLARYGHSEDVPFESGLEAGRLVPRLREAFLAPLIALGLPEAVCSYHFGEASGFLFTFRRGFVEDIEGYGAAAAVRFIAQADRLFALTPIRHLRFWPYRPFPGYGEADRTVFDEEDDPIPLPTFTALVRLPEMARLRALDLRNHGLGDVAVGALLESPHLRPQTLLWLDGNRIGAEARQALRERFGDSVVFEPGWRPAIHSAGDPDNDIPF
jgi:uncharacterized protein (TIGR02996 family)